jgi:hypothetical protein
VRVTGTAQREAWLARTSPPVEQVRPDLWSVPVPIPGSPLRYTLTYLIAAGSGLVVVDPGWNSEAGWQALAEGLKAAGALPAHEYRFHGLADRVRMLLAHHERRCDEVIAILARGGPATVWQVTQELSWSRGWSSVTGFMRRAALAEAGAHLRHLADAGMVAVSAAEAGEPDRYASVT